MTHPLLVGDPGADDPAATVEQLADALTAMPENAPLAGTFHRLNMRPDASGETWLLLLRVPAMVVDEPAGSLAIRIEEAFTAALRREITVMEPPPTTVVHAVVATARDSYDTRRGWIVGAPN